MVVIAQLVPDCPILDSAENSAVGAVVDVVLFLGMRLVAVVLEMVHAKRRAASGLAGCPPDAG